MLPDASKTQYCLPFLALQHLGQSHGRSHGGLEGSHRLAAPSRRRCPITGGSPHPWKLSAVSAPFWHRSAALTGSDSCREAFCATRTV